MIQCCESIWGRLSSCKTCLWSNPKVYEFFRPFTQKCKLSCIHLWDPPEGWPGPCRDLLPIVWVFSIYEWTALEKWKYLRVQMWNQSSTYFPWFLASSVPWGHSHMESVWEAEWGFRARSREGWVLVTEPILNPHMTLVNLFDFFPFSY